MRTFIFILYAFIIALKGSFALAAGGGHAEDITFVGDWLPRLVNFGLLAAVLVFFLRTPTREFFKNRTAMIARSMQESKEAREHAVKALAEMEQKLKDLAAETDRMIDDARVRGEKDKQALVEEGRKVAEGIREQAASGIEVELQKAKAALAVEASLLAIDLAEGRIKDKMDKKDHERIMQEYISRVGGRG